MKAFVLLANGFEDIEAVAPIDILRRGGVDVKTVSITESTEVESSHGIPMKADTTIGKADFENGDALILPGGYPGYKNLGESAAVGKVLKEFYSKGKLVGAICAAPTVLAANGVAEGATVTCHSCAVETMEARYNYVGGDVVSDRNLITAVGAGLSIDFGLELLAALTNEATVEKVKKGMELAIG